MFTSGFFVAWRKVMATASLGRLTLDLVAKISNFEDGMTQAERRAERASKNISNDLNAISIPIKSVAKSLAGMMTINTAIDKMDTYAGMENRLKLVIKSQGDLSQAMSDTFAIAQKTRTGWDASVQIYQRFAQNSDKLGLSMGQVARISETVSKGVAISGTSAESANAAMMQLGQSLASGVLRGEEFNSVNEQANGVLQVLAKGLGVAVGDLKAMANEGKLTTDVLAKGFTNAAGYADELFDKMDMTIGQSFTLLNNEVVKFVGEAGKGSGAATVLSGAIGTLASNLETVTNVAMIGGAYWAGTYIPVIIKGTQATVMGTVAKVADTVASNKKILADYEIAKSNLAATAAMVKAMGTTNEQTAAMMANARAAYQQAAGKKAATLAGMGLSGVLGGPVGLGVIVASVAAGYLLMRDNANEVTNAIDLQGLSAEETTKKLREMNAEQLKLESIKAGDKIAEQNKIISNSLDAIIMRAIKVEQYTGNMAKSNAMVQYMEDLKAGGDKAANALANLEKTKILNPNEIKNMAELGAKVKDARDELKKQEEIQKLVKNASDDTTRSLTNQANATENLINKIQGLNEKQQSAYDKLKQQLAREAYIEHNIKNSKWTREYAEYMAGIRESAGMSFTGVRMPPELLEISKKAFELQQRAEARKKAEQETTKEFEKQQQILRVNAKVQANAAKYNFSSLESKYGLQSGMLSALHMIESKGNANAYNKTTGATGGFQFLEGTAKQYGVKNRNDLGQSAEGAAKYMAYLLDLFKGDLEKAVRAYHAGEGNVMKGKNIGKYNNQYWQDFQGYMAGLNGYSAGDISSKDFERLLGEAAKIAEQQAQARIQLEQGVADRIAQIRHNLAEKIKEIDQAGYSKDKAAEIKAQYQERADNDIAIEQQALKTKLDDYESFLKSEEELLRDSFAKRQFDVLHDLELTKTQREKAKGLLEQQLKQELSLIKLSQDQRLFQAKQSLMSEAAAMQERYRLEREEIALTAKESKNLLLILSMAREEHEKLNNYSTATQNWGQIEASMMGDSQQYSLMQDRDSKYAASDALFEAQMALAETAEAREAVWQAHNERMLMIDKDYYRAKAMLGLDSATETLGTWTGLFGDLLGEQSTAYAAMFALEKGFAVAKAMMAIPDAYSKAYNAVVGIPYVGPYLAPTMGAAAAAAQVVQAGMIKNVNMAAYATGGAISGAGTGTSDSIPIWASNGEYMLNAWASSKLGLATLNYMNNTGQLPKTYATGGAISSDVMQTKTIDNSGRKIDYEAMRSGGQQVAPQVNVAPNIIIQDDRQTLSNYVRSANGQEDILYVIKRNRTALGM